MRIFIIVLLVCIFATVFALNKPTNYYAGAAASGGVRGNQQLVSDFAVWNLTSGNWQHALSPVVSGGSLNGIVAVGTGLLAYGGFTSIGQRAAAGLAYYDGKTWCAPEGLGLFTYTNNATYTQYDTFPTTVASAYASYVSGNTVYLLGTFNQVGLYRDGVAGLVQLTWSAGGIFSISKVGAGYYQQTSVNPTIACTYCPAATQPASGTKNKLLLNVNGGTTYFIFQQNTVGDLYQWKVGDPSWVTITSGNNARNLTGAIQDFDVYNNQIYVVGKFELFNDPNPANQYFHIAVSSDFGFSFQAINNPQPLPVANFGNVPAIVDNYGVTINPALTGSGFSAIAVQSPTSIFVAGGYRVTARNTSQDNLAGELQLRVIQITGAGYNVFSERFASSSYGAAPDFASNPITRLQLVGNDLYAFGPFTFYRQVIVSQGTRFGNRYTDCYKGAAVYGASSKQWSPAFGGFLTKTGDTSPQFYSDSFYMSVSTNNLIYFASNPTTVTNSWGLLTGSLFFYGGDVVNNQNNKWNPTLQNQRFVSALGTTVSSSFPYAAQPIGVNGAINAIRITKQGDAVIIGGKFDWIGSQRIPGIAFYNPDLGTVGSVGGGLYQQNAVPLFYSDQTNYNRIGGVVNDVEELNGYLYAVGLFNRNNSGNCLANVARIAFRVGGAGWEAVDGGCDNVINDALINGNLLYITGAFSSCGLNPEGYTVNGALFQGRVPTSKVAVIDLSLDPTVQSWRPLALGLTGAGAVGNALTYYNGELYVGGTFTTAGGVLYSNGVARWDGTRWKDVVARCQDICSRPNNVYPYIGNTNVPDPNNRKPTSCIALSTLNGNVYCIDSKNPILGNTNVLSYWDGSVWRLTSTLSLQKGIQNSLIVYNGSSTSSILVSGTSTNNVGANGNNFYNWNVNDLNYEPSFNGFSIAPNALASTQN